MAAKLWPVLSSLLIAGVAFGTMFTLTHLPLVSVLELKSLDLLFLLRGRLSPPPEIVIIAIDEPSFAEISRQWPWPRTIHARLVEHLNKGGTRVRRNRAEAPRGAFRRINAIHTTTRWRRGPKVMRWIALRASALPRYKVGMAVEEILEAESGDLTIPITPDSTLLYSGVSC